MNLIYLDNKICGAIDQLVKYFDDGIFNKENVEVVFKIYAQSHLYYKRTLEKHGIKYVAFKSFVKLDLSKYKVIFYLFNAQSNCRIVAYREAVHIFVTHGESNKASSIKPIIRIYDYVICAGQSGIDRFLQSGIFDNHDVEKSRLIRLGDTFIGQPKFYKELNPKQSSILYAPTWEGGVKEENYSSIEKSLLSFKLITNFAKEHNINKIIIQPHPNTGHRNKSYIKYLQIGIEYFLNNNLQICIYRYKKEKFDFIFRIKHKFNKKIEFINDSKEYGIYRAFVDISAMEVQLVNKDIYTNVFFSNSTNAIPENDKLEKYYSKISCEENKNLSYNDSIIENIKLYYISYSYKEVEKLKLNKRVDWLVNYVLNKKGV